MNISMICLTMNKQNSNEETQSVLMMYNPIEYSAKHDKHDVELSMF